MVNAIEIDNKAGRVLFIFFKFLEICSKVNANEANFYASMPLTMRITLDNIFMIVDVTGKNITSK